MCGRVWCHQHLAESKRWVEPTFNLLQGTEVGWAVEYHRDNPSTEYCSHRRGSTVQLKLVGPCRLPRAAQANSTFLKH